MPDEEIEERKEKKKKGAGDGRVFALCPLGQKYFLGVKEGLVAYAAAGYQADKRGFGRHLIFPCHTYRHGLRPWLAVRAADQENNELEWKKKKSN